MNKWERAVRMESLDLLIIFTVFLLFFTSFSLQSDSGNLTVEANCNDDGISRAKISSSNDRKTFSVEQWPRLISLKETF